PGRAGREEGERVAPRRRTRVRDPSPVLEAREPRRKEAGPERARRAGPSGLDERRRELPGERGRVEGHPAAAGEAGHAAAERPERAVFRLEEVRQLTREAGRDALQLPVSEARQAAARGDPEGAVVCEEPRRGADLLLRRDLFE